MPLLKSVVVFGTRNRLFECNIRYLSFHSYGKWYKNEPKLITPLNLSKVASGLYSPVNINFGLRLSKVSSSIAIRHNSTNEGSFPEFNFEKECEETLESLSEHFEELLEGNFLSWAPHNTSSNEIATLILCFD